MDLGSPIASGNTASIYLSEGNVIKLFNDGMDRSYVLYEANKQKSVHGSGLFVPEVLEVKQIEGKQAILMEYIEGSTLGDLCHHNMEKVERYLRISVDVQQKVHKISTVYSLEKMTTKLTRQIESVDKLSSLQKRDLIEKMNSFSFEQKLCHGDFHLFNLILSNEEVAIIDWVDASLGDIRADVYRTYLLYTQHSDELAETYLRLYCESSGLSKEEIFQWAPIIAGARLSENVATEDSDRLIEIVNQYS